MTTNYWCGNCGDTVNPARAALGYKMCMYCGEAQAKQQRASWCVAPMNKSNYVLITDKEVLKQLNPKRT